MIAIRSLVYLLGQIVSAVIIGLLAIFSLMLPVRTRDKIIRTWAQFNIWTLRVVCRVHYKIDGIENIPDHPCIIIANHQSAWETLFFQIIFPPLSFILKRNLLWIPFFGWGLAAYRPIAIDRSQKIKALDQLVKQGAERLAEGRWPVIYPEGTRTPPGKPGKFQVGGAIMAAKTGAMVIPVAHNAGLFWPKNSFMKYPGTVEIVIGKVIRTEGRKTREINAEVEQWIKQTMSGLPGLQDSLSTQNSA